MKRPFRVLVPTIAMLLLSGCDRERSNPVDPQSSSLRKSPPTPTGLTAKPGVGRILLNWQPVVDKDLAGYALFRAARSDGEYGFIPQKGDTTSRVTTGMTSFIDSLDPAGSLDLAGKTFFYRVAAVDTSNVHSERSGFVGAVVLADEVGPGAPLNLSAAVVEDSLGQVRLAWGAPRTDADGGALTGLSGYVVLRSEEGASLVAVDTVSAGARVYVDRGLEELRRYGYVVAGFDASGNVGARSAPVSVETGGIAAPSGLRAVGEIGRVRLEWAASEEADLRGYNVYRSPRSDAGYERLEGVEGAPFTTGRTSYEDTTAAPGGRYFYRVTVVTSDRESGPSGFVGAAVPADEVGPGAPLNLSAVAVAGSPGQVRLTWGAPRTDADGGALTGLSGYVVLRSEEGASLVAVDTVSAGARVYVDRGLEELRRYGYAVAGFDASGNVGARSAPVSVETGGIAAPSGLRAVGEIGRVRLEWTASEAADLRGYNVYRSPRSDAGYERLEGVEGAPFTTGRTSYEDTTAAPGGRYFYRVTVVTSDRESGPSGFVGAAVPADEVGPGAPLNLSAVAVAGSPGQVRLTWGAPRTDADGGPLTGLSGYVVLRSEEGASLVAVDTVSAGARVYVDRGLEELRRYGYAVAGFDASGNVGARSAPVSVETGGIAAPSGLRAVGEIGRVRLEWTASEAADLRGYNVYRSPRSDAGYERLEGVEGAPFTTGRTSYEDTTVVPGGRYFYRVTVVTSDRESGPSGFVGAAVPADEVGPGAPLNLSAVAVAGSPGQVRLTWTAPRTDADGGPLTGLSGYVVLRSEEGASLVAVDTVSAGARVYVDGGLEELRRYGYAVAGFDASGNVGARSAPVSVETGGIAAPSGLRAVGEIGRVRLEWTASDEADLRGYNVYRSPRSDAGYERLEGVEGAPFTTGRTSYEDTTAAPGGRYFYRVTVVTSDRESGPSGFVGAAVPADEVGPGAPLNLSAVAVAGSPGQVRLTWTAPRTDADGGPLTGLSGYVVLRSEEGASLVAVDTVSAGARVYVDRGLEELRRYGYAVAGFDASGNVGARSAPVSVETGGIAAPSGLRAVGEIGRVRLEWTASDEADLRGYNVYRSPRSDAGYERLEGVEGAPFTTGRTSYEDTTVAPGGRYFYRVTVVTSDRESGPSGFVGAAVPADEVGPGAPLNLSAVAVAGSPGEVRLSWGAPRTDADGGPLTGLSGYVVLRSEEGASLVAVDTVAAGVRVYVDGGLEELRRYGYAVAGFDASGNVGARSAPVSVETGGIAAPSGLRAVGEIGRVRLEWTASEAADLRGYNVYRSPRSDAGYERLEGVEGAPFTTGRTSYEDTTVAPGGRYFYRVTVVTSDRESGPSGFVGAVVPADEVGPGAPLNLSAVAVAGSPGQVRLSWAAPRTDADGGPLTGLSGYVVLRSEEGASLVAVDTVSAGVRVYVDGGLEELRRYGYAVAGFDASGNVGARSAPVSVETGGIAAPSGLRAVGEIGRVRLEWTASEEADLRGYNVYRSPRSDAGYERLEGVEGAPFTTGRIAYIDSGLAGGDVFFYRVSALTAQGESSLSAFVGTAVLRDDSPPAAPTFVEGVPLVEDPSMLDITWTAPTADAAGGRLTGLQGFQIYRSRDEDGPFKLVGTAAEAAFVDTGLQELTTYFYQVEALDPSGNASPRSATTPLTTGGVDPPKNVSLSSTTPYNLLYPPVVTISWTAAAGAILHYEVQRTTVAGSEADGDFVDILPNDLSTSRQDDTVSRGETYYYRVRARDVDDRVSVWTALAAVTVSN